MMKKYMQAAGLVLAVTATLVLASCGSNKKVSQAKVDDAVEIKNIPCSECKSTRDIIRSMAMRESMDQQMAKEMARSSALEDMASKIGTSVNAVIDDYRKSSQVNMTEEAKRRFEGRAVQVIDQTVQGYRTICEKYTVSTRPDGSKVYKCYYAIELDKEEVARAVHKTLTSDQSLRLEYDYERFKEEFNAQMNRHDNNR